MAQVGSPLAPPSQPQVALVVARILEPKTADPMQIRCQAPGGRLREIRPRLSNTDTAPRTSGFFGITRYIWGVEIGGCFQRKRHQQSHLVTLPLLAKQAVRIRTVL